MNQRQVDSLRHFVDNLSRNNMIWITQSSTSDCSIYPEVDVNEAMGWIRDWRWIWTNLTRSWQNPSERDRVGNATLRITGTLNVIANLNRLHIRKIYLIPVKRQIGSRDEAFDDLSGRGLIDHLANLQNPQWNKQCDRTQFECICNFVRDVTGKPDAKLEVPSDREHLLVHMDNKVLPLSALGTGIHEVVLIAAFCTNHDGSWMCIEEPEIHLHPLLRRKLVNYFLKNTKKSNILSLPIRLLLLTHRTHQFSASRTMEIRQPLRQY